MAAQVVVPVISHQIQFAGTLVTAALYKAYIKSPFLDIFSPFINHLSRGYFSILGCSRGSAEAMYRRYFFTLNPKLWLIQQTM